DRVTSWQTRFWLSVATRSLPLPVLTPSRQRQIKTLPTAFEFLILWILMLKYRFCFARRFADCAPYERDCCHFPRAAGNRAVFAGCSRGKFSFRFRPNSD